MSKTQRNQIQKYLNGIKRKFIKTHGADSFYDCSEELDEEEYEEYLKFELSNLCERGITYLEISLMKLSLEEKVLNYPEFFGC